MVRRYLETRRIKKDTANRDAVLRIVVEFFGSPEKAQIWMRSKNPLLGGVTPEFMIMIGRSDRLLKFVNNCIEGNFP